MVQNIENNNKNKTRQFHIENYENLKNINNINNIYTYKSYFQKKKINYIFDSYIREIPKKKIDPDRLCPCQECRDKRNKNKDKNEDSTITITSLPTQLIKEYENNNQLPVNINLVNVRYEIKRSHIKHQLSKECKCCGEAW